MKASPATTTLRVAEPATVSGVLPAGGSAGLDPNPVAASAAASSAGQAAGSAAPDPNPAAAFAAVSSASQAAGSAAPDPNPVAASAAASSAGQAAGSAVLDPNPAAASAAVSSAGQAAGSAALDPNSAAAASGVDPASSGATTDPNSAATSVTASGAGPAATSSGPGPNSATVSVVASGAASSAALDPYPAAGGVTTSNPGQHASLLTDRSTPERRSASEKAPVQRGLAYAERLTPLAGGPTLPETAAQPGAAAKQSDDRTGSARATSERGAASEEATSQQGLPAAEPSASPAGGPSQLPATASAGTDTTVSRAATQHGDDAIAAAKFTPQPAAADPSDFGLLDPQAMTATPALVSAPAAKQANPSSGSVSIPPPAQQVASAVVTVAKSEDKNAQVTLRLQPADLGTVQIKIERSETGPTRIEITAEKPETLDLLQRSQAQLHQSLDLAGLPSGGRDITFHVSSFSASLSGTDSPTAGNNPSMNQGSPGFGQSGENPGGNANRGTYSSHAGATGGSQQPDRSAPAASDTVGSAKVYRVGLNITA